MTTEKTTDAGPASVSTDLLERQAFEVWVSAAPFGYDVCRYPNDAARYAWPDQYRRIEVQLAWDAWQAAKKDEREACAKVCENNDGSWADTDWNNAVKHCADKIMARSNA